jgi:probable rRNA maturation factor
MDLHIPSARPTAISAAVLQDLFIKWQDIEQPNLNGEVIVQFVNRQEMEKIAQQHQGQPTATDVLAFNYNPSLTSQLGEKIAGEVVICVDVAQDNAKKLNVAEKNEYATLFVHGLLHLSGRDHATDDQRSRFMEDTRVIMESGGLSTVSLWSD